MVAESPETLIVLFWSPRDTHNWIGKTLHLDIPKYFKLNTDKIEIVIQNVFLVPHSFSL